MKRYTGNILSFYGFPKIHKPFCPLKPIIHYIISHHYKVSKYSSALVKLVKLTLVHSLISSFQFFDDLRMFQFSSGFVMASLDVVTHFTSIPFDVACGVDKNVCPNYSFSPSLGVCFVIDPVRFCLTSNCFVFGYAIYKQINGTAMVCTL